MATLGRLSDYTAKSLLEHLQGVAPFERPVVWGGALTGEPSDDGTTLNEVTASGYSRTRTKWSRASGRLVSNEDVILFDSATKDWGLITHFGLFDSETRGHLLGWFPLSKPTQITPSDILKIEKDTATVEFIPSNPDGSGALSDASVAALLQLMLGVQEFPFPTSLYLGALLAPPTNTGLFQEVAESGYTRVLTNNLWSTATGRVIENKSDITWPVASEDWGSISHIGLFPTSTPGQGVLYWWAPVNNPDTIQSTQILSFPAGDIRLTL